MQRTWLIKNGRIVDAAGRIDEVGDLYVENGIIATPPPVIPDNVPRIDATGLVVTPGLIDLHVHFREPGYEAAETIESGSLAAARGGFTTVVAMPNTQPPADCAESITRTVEQGRKYGKVRVLAAGCITRKRKGRELANLAAMKDAGAVMFTDDGSAVADEALMSDAMRISKGLGLPVSDHAVDLILTGSGVMREGAVSTRLGLPGIPSRAEVRIVDRDIGLAERTGCAVHIQHVSAAESARLIRTARTSGFPVTAEATPHHLALTDSDVSDKNTHFKMNPPLGTEQDREALVHAVISGDIQALATDHAPHTAADKAKGFIKAPFGVIGLETAIGVTYTQLVKPGLMNISDWLRRWTTGPAGVIGLKAPSLAPGRPADITILDLESEWTVQSSEFASKSINTPFEGRRVTGRAVLTMFDGAISWQDKNRLLTR